MTSQGPWALDAKTYQSLLTILEFQPTFSGLCTRSPAMKWRCGSYSGHPSQNRVTPFVHDTWSAMAIGPFTIAFPIAASLD